MLARIASMVSEELTAIFSEDDASPPKYKLDSFADQLKDIINLENRIPLYFLCPISYALMENPLIVNKLQTHTFDEICLKEALNTDTFDQAWLKETTKYDPFNLEIKSIEENIERKKQIEDFVFSFVRIEGLKELITKQEVLLLEEDEINLIKLIKMKIYLATEVDFFIKFVNKIVNVDKDRKLEEKLEEINLINAEKIILLQSLNEELKEYQKLSSLFRKIHKSNMTLEDLKFRKRKYLPHLLKDLLKEHISPDEIVFLINDEEKSLDKEIVRTKIKLAEELQLCMALIEIFNRDQSEYTLQKIFKIFNSEINLLIRLQTDFKEFKKDYPDLFYKSEYEFKLFPPHRVALHLATNTNSTTYKRITYNNE